MEEILLVGFGNMGQALARGWLAGGREAGGIRVVDPVPAARGVAGSLGIAAFERVAEVTGRADVVVLAVKPAELASTVRECRGFSSAGAVLLSIAAGKTLAGIVAELGREAPIVRAMPNTPAAIGRGMTVLAASREVDTVQRAVCGELLAAVGDVAWLDDERHMDAVTAVSGSGPAYVFLFIECLERAALDLGLDAALAKQLALATVAGAGQYAAASEEPAAELRRRVTSPKGTTQAALDVLMADGGLCELVGRAAQAAAARSRELAKG